VISNKSWNPQFIRAESLANLEIGQSNLETDLIFYPMQALALVYPPYGSPHLPPLLEGVRRLRYMGIHQSYEL
jgi:hypothetical protein